MYCNGPNEHYIDLACPFGKTNSALEFCPPVLLFAKSVAVRYGQIYQTPKPDFGAYVDDIYGGFKRCSSYDKSLHLRSFLCQVGRRLSVNFNLEVTKTPLPARVQVILGKCFDSVIGRISTAAVKVVKYRLRIAAMLATRLTTRNAVEKLHGCLNYVAEVEPFGRPFLADLMTVISGTSDGEPVRLSAVARMGLQI